MSQSASLAFTWLPDSRGIVASDISRGVGSNRRITFRRVDLSGGSTVLREVALGDVPNVGAAINATTAVVTRTADHDYRLVPLAGAGAERPFHSGLTGVNTGPSFSADRQWLAFRRAATNNDPFNTIDVMRADGSAESSITLPFAAARGAASLAVLSGGKTVVVVEGQGPGDSGVYQVDVATGSVKKLLAYAARIARTGPPEVAVSPDGRTLLVTQWVAIPPAITAVDLTPLKNSIPR
jgi:dipeptidyl aminopeptidase/acylaminoacyl peptidase